MTTGMLAPARSDKRVADNFVAVLSTSPRIRIMILSRAYVGFECSHQGPRGWILICTYVVHAPEKRRCQVESADNCQSRRFFREACLPPPTVPPTDAQRENHSAVWEAGSLYTTSRAEKSREPASNGVLPSGLIAFVPG